MEGPLSVWTNWITGWHYCWVVLDERLGSLYRFKSHAKRKAGLSLLTRLSGIRLLGAIVTKDPEDPCGFSITSEGKEYRFQAPTANNRDAWVTELEEVVLRQMVCHRAYHMWDRRYIGPTLALINAKLQDASLLYDELAVCAKELDGRVFVLTSEKEKAQLNAVLRDLLAFLSCVRSAINLLMQLKEMILPDFLAQLDTLPPRKKTVTILSFLKKQVDPMSILMPQRSTSTSSTEASPSPSRTTQVPTFQLDTAARQSSEGTASTKRARTTQPTSDDSGPSVSESSGSVSNFVSPHDSVPEMSHAGRTPHKETKKDIQKGPKTAASTKKLQEKSPEKLPSASLPAASKDSSTMQGLSETVPHSGITADSADSLRDLCRMARYGTSMLKTNYPIRLIQPESLLESLARLFASPHYFASIPLKSKASERMLAVVRWYMSALFNVKRDDGILKPYSPILGEIFRCSWGFEYQTPKSKHEEVAKSGPVPIAGSNDLAFVAEQISIWPPISCMYCEHAESGLSFVGHVVPQAFCVGTYMQVHMAGQGTISVLPYSEAYTMAFPSSCIRSVDTSRPWFEFCDSVTISCAESGYHANIKFLAKPPRADSQKHRVFIEVFNSIFKKPFIRIQGCWNGMMDAHWASGEIEHFFDAEDLRLRKRQPEHYIATEGEESKDSHWVWRSVTVSLQIRNFKEAEKQKRDIENATMKLQRLYAKKGSKYESQLFEKAGVGYVFKQNLKSRMNSPENS
ncbi:oxysterol-binding protein-related protein 9-like isoform X2 [Ornithodoros turicata]|uniref:oxysterol-binding protein-related protein 9-like isoform X2 n=1 Tax=Ornithodoros turicata TaxID=34597 RepID=UPI003138FE05